MQFVPKGVTKNNSIPDVPYFEDSQKHDIKGRGTHKSLRVLKEEVENELGLLGGFRVQFHEGDYIDGQKVRHGFRIDFVVSGYPARLDVAALPLLVEAPVKTERALAQALYLLRDWLIAERLSWVYRPTSMPLLQYITGADGRTVIEVMAESGELPLLGSGK